MDSYFNMRNYNNKRSLLLHNNFSVFMILPIKLKSNHDLAYNAIELKPSFIIQNSKNIMFTLIYFLIQFSLPANVLLKLLYFLSLTTLYINLIQTFLKIIDVLFGLIFICKQSLQFIIFFTTLLIQQTVGLNQQCQYLCGQVKKQKSFPIGIKFSTSISETSKIIQQSQANSMKQQLQQQNKEMLEKLSVDFSMDYKGKTNKLENNQKKAKNSFIGWIIATCESQIPKKA